MRVLLRSLPSLCGSLSNNREVAMLIQVEGRHPLNGVYRPSGNPNAALALMAAALLTEAPIQLHNVPQTLTTQALADIARDLGAELTWVDDEMTISSGQITRRVLSQEDTELSVGALLLVAPMLIRRQHVRLEIDFPLNRIRTHLEGLRDLGIDVVTSGRAVELKAAAWDRKEILLSQASVPLHRSCSCWRHDWASRRSSTMPQLNPMFRNSHISCARWGRRLRASAPIF
jgi:UDP-N-acetylglucosamine 1-carboxyvinyltransferase